MSAHRLDQPDRPWVMRTYAGHSDARRSNELYRTNLARGQTGLSVAFDLPTQTGYDPDHPLAKGEVGKVGVRSEEHTSELQSLTNLVCRLLLEKKKQNGQGRSERGWRGKTSTV